LTFIVGAKGAAVELSEFPPPNFRVTAFKDGVVPLADITGSFSSSISVAQFDDDSKKFSIFCKNHVTSQDTILAENVGRGVSNTPALHGTNLSHPRNPSVRPAAPSAGKPTLLKEKIRAIFDPNFQQAAE